MAKKKRGRRGLSSLSTSDLREELRRRESGLSRQRDQLLAQLAALDQEMGGGGGGRGGRRGGRRGSRGGRLGRPPGSGAGRGRGGRRGRRGPRAKNAGNLVSALTSLLSGKTMSVTDAAAKVQEAGYKTTSPNFRTIVNQALISSGAFKRVSRGQYTAK